MKETRRYDPLTIEALFNPKTIAIIGASAETLWSRQILDGLRVKGYRGNAYCVNPSRKSVLGFASYPSVSDLPETPDIGAILLGDRHVPSSLKALKERGCNAAYVLASGYENPDKLEELRRLANELGMIIIGPNCNGFVNVGANLHLWTGPLNRPYKQGSIAIIGQSSAVMNAMEGSIWDRGLGLTFMISTGNQANFTLVDALAYLSTHADTRVVICYVEQFGDYPHFVEAVQQCRQANIPVIVLAVGRSESARRAAMGHTGAVTTHGDISRAAIEAAGAIPVDDLEEAIDRASLFAVAPKKAWRPIKTAAVITISGGWASLMGDCLHDEGIATPPLPESVTSQLPSYVENVTFNNPFDITAQLYAWAEAYYDIVDAMVQAEEFDAVTIMFGNWHGGERFYAPVQGWAYKVNKPVLGAAMDASALAAEYRSLIENDPMPYLNGGQRIARAMAGMRRYFENPGYLPVGWGKGEGQKWTGEATATFPELAPKLVEYGITVAPYFIIQKNDQPSKPNLQDLTFPVALKLESPDLPHKTEAGAVRLHIQDLQQLMRETNALANLAVQKNLKTWSIMAQSMVTHDSSIEMMLGAIVDPVVGPVLAVSMGGIFTELMEKRVFAVCPINLTQAEAIIHQLGIDKFLSGFRGSLELDKESLLQTLVNVSTFIYDYRNHLRELDLNPVIVPPKGQKAIVVDALAAFQNT